MMVYPVGFVFFLVFVFSFFVFVFFFLHTSNIRVRMTKYDNMQVIYLSGAHDTYTLVTYQCIGAINMKCTIFSLHSIFTCARVMPCIHVRAQVPHTCATLLYHTQRLRGYLHETGTNSDRHEFVSTSIHFLLCVYMRPA